MQEEGADLPRKKASCWLCSCQGDALGIRLNGFIVRHIGVMDLACISTQVSDYLLLNHPKANGASADDVFAHISQHMLHPRVRMAVILRQLLDFSTVLQNGMMTSDECGNSTIDKTNVELYLKVVSQITTLYKIDTGSMLFSDDENHPGKGGGNSGSHGVNVPSF